MLFAAWLIIAYPILAQDKTTTKVETKQQQVSVNVSKDDNGERNIKVTISEDGEEKVIEWSDQGKVPDDVQKELDDAGVVIDFDDMGGRDSKMNRMEKKQIRVFKMNDEDEVSEMEWDGDGEMPEEIREMLEENEIDIRGLDKSNEKMRKIRIRKGNQSPFDREKEVEIIIDVDDEDVPSIFEWNDDRGLKWQGGNRGRGNVMFFSDSDRNATKAYLGARIGEVENGAEIVEILKDGPSDKANLKEKDIIQRMNGARVRSMDDVLDLLRFYEPNDKIELVIMRDGSEKKLSLTLGTRPDNFR
jgi:hypothetical protein